jgi:hypothetical protein
MVWSLFAEQTIILNGSQISKNVSLSSALSFSAFTNILEKALYSLFIKKAKYMCKYHSRIIENGFKRLNNSPSVSANTAASMREAYWDQISYWIMWFCEVLNNERFEITIYNQLQLTKTEACKYQP